MQVLSDADGDTGGRIASAEAVPGKGGSPSGLGLGGEMQGGLATCVVATNPAAPSRGRTTESLRSGDSSPERAGGLDIYPHLG
ncbi:MAG TPA: hypothetical protein VGK19_12500 [Capsulimonadaceae bacterium]